MILLRYKYRVQLRMRRPLTCILFIATFLFSGFAKANTVPVSQLNDYVKFTNESIHGMLIVHRLLELYNQDINKYVDLDGHELNDFSNADLPKNIFEDPDQWFFDESPLKIYDRILKSTSSLKSKDLTTLNKYCKEMKRICTEINNIRFNVENYIKENDLNDPLKLKGVYDRLERGVDLYQEFHEVQIKLEKKLNTTFLQSIKSSKNTNPIPELGKQMFIANNAFKKALRALRSKEDKEIESVANFAKQSIANVKGGLLKQKGPDAFESKREKAIDKLDKALLSVTDFYRTAEVPNEYKLYGKFYFYHNSDVINKVNRYGNGFVNEMNKIIDLLDMSFLHLFEEAHFYQVIYPEKLVKKEFIKSSDDVLDILPTSLKDREIVTNSRKIKVDSAQISFLLYDHLIQDGDIVSINYNGDWILESYSLETAAKTLKLELNKKGKNYLLLHAESIGKRPPNTMTIAYTYKGKKERLVLKSDLNASELIEIEIDQSGS